MPVPARDDPHPVFFPMFFRRTGIVEHLFGERSVIDRLYRLTTPGEAHENPRLSRGPSCAVTVIDKCGQATKGVWWMSWHREATKDVVACDKLREAGKRALIRRFLNEETQLGSLPITAR